MDIRLYFQVFVIQCCTCDTLILVQSGQEWIYVKTALLSRPIYWIVATVLILFKLYMLICCKGATYTYVLVYQWAIMTSCLRVCLFYLIIDLTLSC